MSDDRLSDERIEALTKERIKALGVTIVDVSMTIAEGYKRQGEESCAVAASNTGAFILRALGFSGDEIKALVNERCLAAHDGGRGKDAPHRPESDPCAICGAPWRQCVCGTGTQPDF